MPAMYEQFYLGAFIHLAGYKAGLRRMRHPPAVTLYQQSPKDQSLGDLFWGSDAQCLLFEFKANPHGLSREREKPVKRKVLEALGQHRDSEIRAIADRAHYLVIGDVPGPIPDGFRVARYSLLARSFTPRELVAESFAVGRFLDLLMRRGSPFGCPAAEFRTYVEFLQRCVDSGTATGTSGRRIASAEPTGLVMTVSAGGDFTFAPFSTLEQLRGMTCSLPELQQEEEIQWAASERTRSLEMDHDLER